MCICYSSATFQKIRATSENPAWLLVIWEGRKGNGIICEYSHAVWGLSSLPSIKLWAMNSACPLICRENGILMSILCHRCLIWAQHRWCEHPPSSFKWGFQKQGCDLGIWALLEAFRTRRAQFPARSVIFCGCFEEPGLGVGFLWNCTERCTLEYRHLIQTAQSQMSGIVFHRLWSSA